MASIDRQLDAVFKKVGKPVEDVPDFDLSGDGGQTAAVDTFQGNIPDQLADYWLRGKGAARVRWCTRGAFRRARRLLRGKVPAHMLDGTVANLYHRACGRWPGRRGNEAALAADAAMLPPADVNENPIGDTSPAENEGVGYNRIYWSGPLAPIDIATGDRRQFATGALSTRQLPLQLSWQEKRAQGHDGSVVVGSLTGYEIAEDGTIMGRGYFLNPDIIPEVSRAVHLVEHGVVGPSVDLEPDMDVTWVDEQGEAFDTQQCQIDGTCPDKPKALITEATIVGATLVPITAFAEARAPKMSHGSEFCLNPLHPGPCASGSSGGGGGGGGGKGKTKESATKKPPKPAEETKPSEQAQAPGRGVIDALIREKFLDTPQTANNDQTPEERAAEEERAANQARVQARREQRAAVRARVTAARERYGARSKWPKRVRATVEREEEKVREMSNQTASTSLTACGCATRAGVSEFSVSTDGTACACDPDGVERPMSAGGEFCACSSSQTAAVRDDFDDMPFASRDMAWDVADAEAAIARWATNEDGDIDFDRYRRAFIYQDPDADPGTKGAYKFPVATVMGGELTIVPRAVSAAAGRLNQANVSSDAREQIRATLTDLYDQMSEEFDDDAIQAPWEMAMDDVEVEEEDDFDTPDDIVSTYGADVHGGEFCGECGGDPLDQVAAAYGVFGDIPPYPITAFQRTADGPTPMTVLEDGSVFGHIAAWDSCNRGIRGRCVPAPKSKTNYAQFHTTPVRTSEGTLRVGKIVMGEGHADVNGTMQVTKAWYDKAGKTAAHGRAHEDQWGIFFSGVVGPNLTPAEAVEFFSMPPSGHWTEHRPTRSSELIAVAAVNVPGHPVAGPDLVLNQVASGYFEPEAETVDDAASVFTILDQADWADEAAKLSFNLL